MKKKLTALLLGMCVLSLAACSSSENQSKSEEEAAEETEEESAVETDIVDLDLKTPSEEGVTEQDLLDVREEHTVELENGTFTFRLTEAYVGSDAEEQLEAMGENVDDFFLFEEGFRFVLLEYQVKADNGFEDEPFSGDDLLGYDVWQTDLTQTCPYYCIDLDSGLNYTNVTLHAGEESTAYALYEMPEDLDAFADCLNGKNEDYWFLYQL